MTDAAAPASARLVLQRLAHSRVRLLEALRPSGAAAGASREPRPASLPSSSGAALLLELAQAWWSEQPWPAALGAAALAARTLLRPLARQHPVMLVLGAGLAGVALVRLRPAIGLRLPGLWAGVVPPLVRAALARWPGGAPGSGPPA